MKKWHKQCPDQQQENTNRMWRLEYFRNSFLLGLIIYFISAIVTATWVEGMALYAFNGILLIITAITCTIPRTIKRCHDIWWSGWWAILFIMPIVNIALFFIPWTNGDNKYGPKPD